MPWHLVFGVDGAHVTTTIVGGNVLMYDRVLLMIDEEHIAAQAREVAPRLWQRFADLSLRDK